MSVVLQKNYSALPVCEREILRYAGCKTADEGVISLLNECLGELSKQLDFRICYTFLPVSVVGDVCNFDVFSVQSKDLSARLCGCDGVVLFASTIGIGVDRLIEKYGKLQPSKAFVCQAVGTERVESLCNRFCEDIAKENGLQTTARFSAGYGDLPLAVQRDIFAVLDCERRIGACLNDSLLTSPSKTVTAFLGYRVRDERVNDVNTENK
jgi:hypothetical protein